MAQTSIGERLRQAREAIPASLTEASRATRVRVDFLEAMERDSFNFITGRVYVIGMLRSYARWLRLDEDEIAAEFDRVHGVEESPALRESLAPRKPDTRVPSFGSRSQPWTIAGAAAGGILVVLLLFSLLHGGGKTAPPVAVSPTASPTAGSPGPGVVPTTGVPPASPPPAPSPSPSPSPASAAPGGGVQVLIVASRSSRVQVLAGNTIPGLLEFDATLAPGGTRTFSAGDLLRVYFANMGAVSLIVNGRNVGAPGASGQAGGFDIKPDGSLTPDPALPDTTVPRAFVSTAPPPPVVVHPAPSPSPVASPSPAVSPPPSSGPGPSPSP